MGTTQRLSSEQFNKLLTDDDQFDLIVRPNGKVETRNARREQDRPVPAVQEPPVAERSPERFD